MRKGLSGSDSFSVVVDAPGRVPSVARATSVRRVQRLVRRYQLAFDREGARIVVFGTASTWKPWVRDATGWRREGRVAGLAF